MKDKVPGQVPLFYEEDALLPEVPYIGPGVDRNEIQTRAGTVLDHRWTHRVEGRGRRGVRQHGLYDEKQRIYQTGGELSNFIYWKRHLVSIAYEAWSQVWQKVDWIEVIDHEKTECWRISMGKAKKHAVKYDAGIGPRIGIPMELWDVITARGTIRQEGKSQWSETGPVVAIHTGEGNA